MSHIPLSLLMLVPAAMAALALFTLLAAAAIGRGVARLAVQPAILRPPHQRAR